MRDGTNRRVHGDDASARATTYRARPVFFGGRWDGSIERAATRIEAATASKSNDSRSAVRRPSHSPSCTTANRRTVSSRCTCDRSACSDDATRSTNSTLPWTMPISTLITLNVGPDRSVADLLPPPWATRPEDPVPRRRFSGMLDPRRRVRRNLPLPAPFVVLRTSHSVSACSSLGTSRVQADPYRCRWLSRRAASLVELPQHADTPVVEHHVVGLEPNACAWVEILRNAVPRTTAYHGVVAIALPAVRPLPHVPDHV